MVLGLVITLTIQMALTKAEVVTKVKVKAAVVGQQIAKREKKLNKAKRT